MPGVKASPKKSLSPSKKGKGKQRATTADAPSPASSTRSRDATDAPAHKKAVSASPMKNGKKAKKEQVQEEDENELLSLAERIAESAHLLVKGRGSDELAQEARHVVKRSFDKAIASESLAFPHLSTLLASLSPAAGPSTRSRSAASFADDEPSFSLVPTPIPELTTDGMDAEMIWEQMELRGQTVNGLMEEMFGQGEEDEGEEGEGEFGSDEEEEGEEGEFGQELEDEDEVEEGSDAEDDEDIDFDDLPEAAKEEYYRRLGEGEDGETEDEEDEGEERQEPQADPLTDETSGLTLDNFDGDRKGKKRRTERGVRAILASGPKSEVDDAFFSLSDFHRDANEGEYEMAKMLRGEVPSDDEDDEDEDGSGGIDLFAPIGGMGDDDDEEDEEEGDLDAGGVMFKDFFDPPSRPPPRGKKASLAGKKVKAPLPAAEADDGAIEEKKEKKRGVRFSESVKVKEIPHRLAGKKRRAGDDDEEDEDEEGIEMLRDLVDGDEAEEDEEDFDDEMDGSVDGEGESMSLDAEDDEEAEDGEGLDEEEEEGSADGEEEDDILEDEQTMQRFKSELFDDEEPEDDKTKNMSRHERRLLQLSSQIAALEQENVGPKDWTLIGEAQSKQRPVNSLLDEDLEFERMGKVAPVITEETTKSIEDLIKKRILDNQFDDVERRVAVDPNQFLPSRFMELQDTKSQKSLAEVYEDEFREKRDKDEGREVVHELDKDLQKRHDEIEALFEDLAARLDALSNARFTPKAPKAAITTVTNLPSISVESALPTAFSTTTLLAPEEIYSAKGAQSALAIDAADLTPAQKKAQRQKQRKDRKAVAEKTERILASQRRKKGARGEKEAAEEKLLGTRGVTVIGKGGAEKKAAGKKRKRGDADGLGGSGAQSSVGLKL
ncbi:U3 small nucleolar RNA-associated protein MPP10 [Rhodotorula toruloides NP11]|uniref:U3 small nucleolar RNA-associated protein MPP10 n=1 Tax=Rhodotorula toruloides (strain NP11) TaxID=1130832 RepID=M7WWA6_RHOT1|nr:U3 small nucleolar RNA-associated protein MPP10 [Rhodotorula toruloides NP11]EMS24877.1 U3 small nucleolar RNA-associated protein MPP10 [Rhodotorula toruloides NP11]